MLGGGQETADHMVHPHHWYQWAIILGTIITLVVGVYIKLKKLRGRN